MVLRSARAPLFYPEIPVDEILRRTARRMPDKLAIAYPRDVTFKELDTMADRFAAALVDVGVKKGDRVGVYLPNCLEFEAAYYGLARAGGVLAPMNPMYKEMEVEFEAKDSEAVGIVCLDKAYPIVKKVVETGKTNLKWVSVVGEKQSDTYSFTEWLEKYPPRPPKNVYNVKEDLAVLAYTAGTTGDPKAVMLTHYNLVSNMIQGVTALGLRENEVCLTVLPLYHIYALNLIMGVAVYAGATQAIMSRFDLAQFCELVEKYRITYINMVTPMFLLVADYLEKPETRKYDWSPLRFVNNGAAPIPRALTERFQKVIKERCDSSAIVTQGWGLSEASPIVAFLPFSRIKIESQGVLVSDTEHMIIDPATGAELPIGERGEIIVKGPQVMKGYWKKPPDEGFITVKGEKWLRTGDIAYLDEEGYEYLVDRIKEVIKYKGYTIAPFELENLLANHPAVKDVAVIGKPITVVGEIPKAFVVVKPQYLGKITQEEIIDWVKERISEYKRIREVEFVDSVPRSSAGKLLRRELRAQELKKLGMT